MRPIRPLVAHAFVSLAIVGASLIAMTATLGGIRLEREPTASAAVAPAQLSTAGRLAYWRPSPGDEQELWVSDLDGHRRFPIATAPKKANVDLTRWSPDGDAVAWHADGEVHVVRLDRTRTTISLPADLLESRWRVMAIEWSPRSDRLAATLRAANGLGNESDVFLASLDRTATVWSRRTRTADSLVAGWLGVDRLLIETSDAAVGVLPVDGTEPMRPLTAMRMVSPKVGPDGRIWMFGGRWASLGLYSGPLAAGTVWSITVDGGDVRRVSAVERDQARLHSILPDGRPVIGQPNALYVVGDEPVLFPWMTGSVGRVVASQDGKHVIAFTETRVLRADLAKIPRTTPAGAEPFEATTVVIDGVKAPDVWFPSRPVALSRSAPVPGPREELVFTLARSLWRLGPDGELRSVLSNAWDHWGGASVVSPGGRLIAANLHVRREADGRYEPVTVLMDREGRWVGSLSGYVPPGAWSADGSRLLLIRSEIGSGRSWLEVFDASTWTSIGRYEHGRGAFSSEGLVLSGEGRHHPRLPQAAWARVGQQIELVTAAGRYAITDADALARHPLARDLPTGTDFHPMITEVRPSASGAYVIVGLNALDPAGGNRHGPMLVVRVSDGQPVAVLRAPEGHGYEPTTWSPRAELLATTRTRSGPSWSDSATTVILDATGVIRFERPGRFAGWSLDGASVYVARTDGLYEAPLSSGDEVRVSALGVAPVTATRP